jgi:hypothetical protein
MAGMPGRVSSTRKRCTAFVTSHSRAGRASRRRSRHVPVPCAEQLAPRRRRAPWCRTARPRTHLGELPSTVMRSTRSRRRAGPAERRGRGTAVIRWPPASRRLLAQRRDGCPCAGRSIIRSGNGADDVRGEVIVGAGAVHLGDSPAGRRRAAVSGWGRLEAHHGEPRRSRPPSPLRPWRPRPARSSPGTTAHRWSTQ